MRTQLAIKIGTLAAMAAILAGFSALAFLGADAYRQRASASAALASAAPTGFSDIAPALSWLDREWSRSPERFVSAYSRLLSTASQRKVPIGTDSILRAMESSHLEFCQTVAGIEPVPESLGTFCEASLRPFSGISNPAPPDWQPRDCGSYRFPDNRDACSQVLNETLSSVSDRHCSSVACMNDHAAFFASLRSVSPEFLCQKQAVPAAIAECVAFIGRLGEYRSSPVHTSAVSELENSDDPIVRAAREAVYSDSPSSQCAQLRPSDAERCESLAKNALERIESDREYRRFRRIISALESSR